MALTYISDGNSSGFCSIYVAPPIPIKKRKHGNLLFSEYIINKKVTRTFIIVMKNAYP